MVHTAVLRVRIEPGIPKLLVKINPQDAEAFQAKNLGEVTLRKGSGSRSQVAVLHMSRGTANGEVLMSVKLADLLDLEDGEGVEVAAAAASQGPMPRRAAPTETGQREQPRPQPSLWEAKPRPSLDPKEWFRSLEKEQEMRARLNGHSGFGSDWSSRGANPPERRSSWCEGSRIPEFRSAAATHRPSQTSTPLSSDWLRSMRGGLEFGRSRPGASGAWDFDAEKLRSKAASRLSSSTGAFSAPWQEENSSPPWAEKSAAPEAPSFSARTERVERDRARPGASQPFGLRQEQRRPAQAPVPPREAPREAALRERVQPGAPAPPSAPPEPGRIRQSPRNRMRAGPYMTQEALVQPCKGHPESGASSRAASTPSSPPESPSEGESGSSGSNLSRPNSSVSSQMRAKAEESDSAQSQPVSLPLALVPCEEKCFGACTAKRKESSGSLLRKRRSTLGLLQQDTAEPLRSSGRRGKVPDQWMPPLDASTGGLERSELGLEATSEVRRWLLGQTSGQQCSQVILDRALTVLSNFKLASGCDLEVLGGPLGALVGGYSDADWLYEEVFEKHPAEALKESFALLGFRSRSEGDWSGVSVEEISLVYRRMCLRGHPSRGGSPKDYLKLQVAMELIKAFCGDAGPLEGPRPPSRGPDVSLCIEKSDNHFVLSDLALAHELQLSVEEAEKEAAQLGQEHLEELNRALDEYILRQMCFKSEIVDEIARLHEDSAYAILGVSSSATDAEIKKAYKLIAMQCHPDKGGDKEDFQELTNAYEKIMEQRRSDGPKDRRGNATCESDEEPTPEKVPRKEKRDKREDAEEEESKEEETRGEEKDREAKGGSQDKDNATLLEKASKAAEEASRYAKTAAEFAHQAAEAAEAARRDQERGSRDSLTKSVAHSAIVYTLTVVKAVRAVGYATLDVAAQCRAAAKRNPEAASCAEHAVNAMSLGLEALNSALSCAEVTEITAAELQATEPGPAAERFAGAAVRASLAAAGASNVAMSAAIAAVEGSRQCAKALETVGKPQAEDDRADEATDAGEAHEDSEGSDSEPEPKRVTPEKAASSVLPRLVAQRNNNHKVLQRLNAEILGHQRNVREFLCQNRQLIPEVPAASKLKIFRLLRDYAIEAWADLGREEAGRGDLLERLEQLPLLVPFLQPQSLAIPVSVKARVLKMAALYDLPLTMQLLDEELLSRARQSLLVQDSFAAKLEELAEKVRAELASSAEDAACITGGGAGAQAPASA